MSSHPRLSVGLICLLYVCVACGGTDDPDTNASSVDAATQNVTTIQDDGGAVWGQLARAGPRRTTDTELVVVPQSADLDE